PGYSAPGGLLGAAAAPARGRRGPPPAGRRPDRPRPGWCGKRGCRGRRPRPGGTAPRPRRSDRRGRPGPRGRAAPRRAGGPEPAPGPGRARSVRFASPGGSVGPGQRVPRWTTRTPQRKETPADPRRPVFGDSAFATRWQGPVVSELALRLPKSRKTSEVSSANPVLASGQAMFSEPQASARGWRSLADAWGSEKPGRGGKPRKGHPLTPDPSPPKGRAPQEQGTRNGHRFPSVIRPSELPPGTALRLVRPPGRAAAHEVGHLL